MLCSILIYYTIYSNVNKKETYEGPTPSTNYKIQNFKSSYDQSITSITENINTLMGYLTPTNPTVEPFDNLPSVDINKKEISGYIVFS
jgi:hypothetical protein